MSDYTSFFLNSGAGVVPLECIEIDHPSFTEAFHYVRNDTSGVVAGGKSYLYQPLSIQRSNVTNDLDQAMSITLADMQDELMQAIVAVRSSSYATTRPTFKYRVFRDDDLTEPMVELQTLEIASISKDSSGLATFDATAPELNSVATGAVYTFEQFPLLRGTL